MEGNISLTFALAYGFAHAFEADHLLAVSTLVSKSKNTRQVLNNGFIWGLGHTSTIFIMGVLLLIFQVHTLKNYFDSLEIFVGIMLIVLGGIRIIRTQRNQDTQHDHTHDREAYGIGLVHGLAGSGALILLVMADLDSNLEAISFLLLFGLGSALGMAVAAIVLRMPLISGKLFSERKKIFSWLAALLCIGYGLHILIGYF
ncbi:MAG: urease accessory protein [Bacteroidota bacterium]